VNGTSRQHRGGVTTGSEGESRYENQLGHGTAIAALLHQQAPQAQLIAVKVFDAPWPRIAILSFGPLIGACKMKSTSSI